MTAGTSSAALRGETMSQHAFEAIGAGRSIRQAVQELVSRHEPGAEVLAVRELGSDADVSDTTLKATGYGAVLRILTVSPSGRERRLVLHLAASNDYGHDRRGDRVGSLVLAYDSYSELPRHARALDVGLLAPNGRMISLSRGEPYLLTEWVEGRPYAEDLRAIASRGRAEPADRRRVHALAAYLAALHAPVERGPAAYQRAVRDLIGHGEGIFGIVDGYPAGVPGAPPERLAAIERSCLAWRWRLKDKSQRLRRTHGDFHPFNVLFDERGEVAVLDTSRGSMGDPADDVAAMAINYLFFALDHPGAWSALGPLWQGFFDDYLALRRDDGLFEVIAPFFAWRALVLASPRWYPRLSAGSRDLLLRLAERALAAPRFHPAMATELVAEAGVV